MSNPTEQPIDPNKMNVYCDVCQIVLIGVDNWENHLESKEHKEKTS